MLEALFGGGPFVRVEGKHGQQEACELLRDFWVPLILFGQNVEKAPRLEFCDVSKFACMENYNLERQKK